MSLVEINPLTQVYNALVDMLREREVLKGMVRPGNFIRLSGEMDDPLKEEVLSADFPEIRIISIATIPHHQRTSNSTSLLKSFQIQISTGDQRVDLLLALEWEIHRALIGWQAKLLTLTWNDKTFVKLSKPSQIQDGVSDTDLNRGIKGWSAIWTCEIEMWFTTTDMQAT